MTAKIKLFCLPFAGGSALFYNRWKQYLKADIELISIELAGRGKRICDPLYTDFEQAVTDVFQWIEPQIADQPYFLFGHSMGALIAYDVFQKILSANLTPPLHTFFSGCRAPHLQNRTKIFHLMGDDDFRREVLDMGGTDPQLFDYPELIDLFIPLLRNDFRIVEQRPNALKVRPLPTPITVFLGKDDDFNADQCDGWKRHTRNLCSIYHFEGGHFFLQQHLRQLVHIIDTRAQMYRR